MKRLITILFVLIITFVTIIVVNIKSEENTKTKIHEITPTCTSLISPEITPKPTPVFVEEAYKPWYIHVDTYNQVVTVYAMDEMESYSFVVKEFITSSGTKARDYECKTVYMLHTVGYDGWVFKRDLDKLDLFKPAGYATYLTRIYKPFLFHTVLFEDRDLTDVIDETYYDLSFPASHGCMRLLPCDAKWIYDNVDVGNIVHTTKGESNPEITQRLQPYPLKSEDTIPTQPPILYPRETSPPQVDWSELDKRPDWEANPDLYG